MFDPVQIRLDLSHPATQTIAVSIYWIPQTQRQTFQLPVWTPGSYTVRDHAQHLHSLLLLANGEELPAIDNLIKGQAGQGVQCLNLMAGLAPETGLPLQSFYP